MRTLDENDVNLLFLRQAGVIAHRKIWLSNLLGDHIVNSPPDFQLLGSISCHSIAAYDNLSSFVKLLEDDNPLSYGYLLCLEAFIKYPWEAILALSLPFLLKTWIFLMELPSGLREPINL